MFAPAGAIDVNVSGQKQCKNAADKNVVKLTLVVKRSITKDIVRSTALSGTYPKMAHGSFSLTGNGSSRVSSIFSFRTEATAGQRESCGASKLMLAFNS